jgi:PIN domain nuclease of toxin-antitoxin system
MVLDTCALLWLSEGSSQLSKNARRRLAAAPLVYVSAISAFEVGLKHRSGKLSLPVPPAEWFGAVVKHHALTVHGLDWEICIAATSLPAIHKDPCDRFIIATARRLAMPVVTSDPNFAAYGIEVVS